MRARSNKNMPAAGVRVSAMFAAATISDLKSRNRARMIGREDRSQQEADNNPGQS